MPPIISILVDGNLTCVTLLILHLETEQKPRALLSLFYRDKGPDDKGKAKKKPKKITKVKPKESQDDGGGWTEVKGSSLSASVCVCTLHITYLFIYLLIYLFIYLFIYISSYNSSPIFI